MKGKYIMTALLFAATIAGCGTKELASGISKSNMNEEVAPGTDFYQYTGGGWMKANPLTAEYSRYGQFNVLSDLNEKQLHQMFEDYANAPQEKGTLGQKIGDIYKLAMDSVRLNNEGFSPIKPYIEKVRAITTREEYIDLITEYDKLGVSNLMFGVGVGADLGNADMNIVSISQSGLGLGNRDYYLDDNEQNLKVRQAYQSFLKKLFEMVGDNEELASTKAERILALETEIAKKSHSLTELRDIEKNYHKMTYAEFTAEYAKLDWDKLFAGLGYPKFEDIDVSQPSHLKQVEELLNNASLEDLKYYEEASIIKGATSFMSDDFRAAAFDLRKVLTGAEIDRPRWKRAVSTVDGVLGEGVGKLYVEKYFPESSKQRMLQLVENLKVALGEKIQGAEWMSPQTKEQAMQKLANFKVKIGYPDKWKDYSKLEVDPSLSYYDNMLKASQFYMQDEIERKVNKPVDKEEWYMNPQTINAYYMPTTNEICFPAGILQKPFFDPEADDAANYGAIGVIIGHEMSHGFDDQGSQFDSEGNWRNWWTPEDKEQFDARTKVLEDYFSTLEVLPGLYINGKLTLGENIGDNGGLNIAFQAFQNAMKENPSGNKDGFTPEQRFFISYGFIWAENIRDEALRQQTLNDPHSVNKFRVNGALPQIDAWYEAFGIKEGDPLYLAPEKRAHIW